MRVDDAVGRRQAQARGKVLELFPHLFGTGSFDFHVEDPDWGIWHTGSLTAANYQLTAKKDRRKPYQECPTEEKKPPPRQPHPPKTKTPDRPGPNLSQMFT